MSVIPCPHCSLSVPLPGPRLIATAYLPPAYMIDPHWLYLTDPKYLLLADDQDVALMDGEACIKHYIYIRPAHA